jgi:thiamine biosynthesis lipoprotein ApbE
MGRWWAINGKKYGHLINPFNSMPITEARTALIVTPSATRAEALTKPLVLLGQMALFTVEKFPDTEAVVLPDKSTPVFSREFRSRSSWKEILQ